MNLSKTLLSLALVSVFFCSSCIENSFFQSPLTGNDNAYHAMPVSSDSVKSATYASGALSAGSMNEGLRDFVFSFKAGLHRSHVLDNFRLNYGATVALGSYDIESFYNYNGYSNNNYIAGGTKFFGAYGAFGGISAAMPLGRGGEWRYIGVEGTLFNEFGSYYNFRKNLPDSAATEIDKKKYLGSAGVNTEIIVKGRHQNKFGIKLALGSYLRTLHYYDGYSSMYNYNQHSSLLYFSNTYHFTFKKSTTYFQFNFATHAAHFQIGYNYRL